MPDLKPLNVIRRLFAYVIGLWRQPHWWAENWSAVVMIAWPLFSLIGKPLSDRAPYAAMTSLAPAQMWEYVALCAGLFQLFALVLNNRWVRALAAFICAWFFSFVLVSFARENNFPPAMALYGGYVGINWMAMYKLLRGTA